MRFSEPAFHTKLAVAAERDAVQLNGDRLHRFLTVPAPRIACVLPLAAIPAMFGRSEFGITTRASGRWGASASLIVFRSRTETVLWAIRSST